MIECPACGANLKFDPKSQRMRCDFCGSDFDPKQFNVENDAEEQVVSSEYIDDQSEDTYDVTIYTCPQCGGELLSVDANTAAAFCSFCGASTILNSRISKGKRPEFIIPFSKTKEDCKIAYRNVVKKALFLPKEYKSEKYIDGFRGIYMPYWTYDIKQKGPVRLKGETSHRSGDYIITDHYALTGNLDAEYDGVSYDASSSLSDSISEALAPYDIKKCIPFEPSYMSGYYADIADVGKDVYAEDAKGFAYSASVNRIKNETPEFRKYTITEETTGNGEGGGSAFATDSVKGHSAMFPVWFMSYRNGDRVAYATVNGQTGKVVADLPIDVKKYLIASGIMAAVIFITLNLFLVLTPKTVLVLASLLTVAVFMINAFQRSSIKKADTGEGDKGLESVNGKTAKKNKNAENDEISMSTSEKITTILGSMSVATAVLVLFFLKTVSDLPYYILCVIDAVFFGLSFRHTLHDYNIMATRKLPQFDRKGGDDRA